MKFKKVLVRFITTVVAATMFSSMVFAAENTTLSNAPVKKVQQNTDGFQYVGQGNGISDVPEAGNPSARLTPDEYKKIDRMAMRQIRVFPMWMDADGNLKYGGLYKEDSSWAVFQQSIGLSVTAAEKEIMIDYAKSQGTPVGFYTEVQFEITGAGSTAYRSVVTRIPENNAPINGIGNGVWAIALKTPLNNPKMRWEGYFQYWNQFQNPGIRTAHFDSFVNFAN